MPGDRYEMDDRDEGLFRPKNSRAIDESTAMLFIHMPMCERMNVCMLRCIT
jgi:hypothetical protein